MGIGDIEAELYGDIDNDEDLEAELLALQGKQPARKKPKGICHRMDKSSAGVAFSSN